MNNSHPLHTPSTSLRLPGRQLILAFLLPKISDSVWIGALLFVSQFGRNMMNADGDLGRHLTIGRYILASGRIPTVDLFSHTLYGLPLTPHEWLSQVIFAVSYRWWGFAGVTLVCGLVIATTFWLVYKISRTSSGSLFAALLVTLLAVFASLLHWLSRPHLFTFLLLALWMHELEALRSASGRIPGRRWWAFPLLMVFWANLHGAFIAGFVTWGLYGMGIAADAVLHPAGAEEEVGSRRSFWVAYLLAGGTSLLATLLNPSGLHLWDTSVGYLGNKFLVDITVEYRSPDFHSLSAQPFLLLIGLVALLFGLRRRRLPAALVLVTAAWLVMALYSARNIPLFAILSAPVLACLFGDWFQRAARLKALRGWWNLDQGLLKMELTLRGFLYPLLALLWIVYTFTGGGIQTRPPVAYQSDRFPVEAVDWLAAHPQTGRVFNAFTWGGYLLYRLWPDQRVFIDGQTDFYGEALTREYLQVIDLEEGWEQILAKYEVGWVIVPTGEDLAAELRAHPDWKSVYQDDTAQIFTLEP